jgi:hypothetical protein
VTFSLDVCEEGENREREGRNLGFADDANLMRNVRMRAASEGNEASRGARLPVTLRQGSKKDPDRTAHTLAVQPIFCTNPPRGGTRLHAA